MQTTIYTAIAAASMAALCACTTPAATPSAPEAAGAAPPAGYALQQLGRFPGLGSAYGFNGSLLPYVSRVGGALNFADLNAHAVYSMPGLSNVLQTRIAPGGLNLAYSTALGLGRLNLRSDALALTPPIIHSGVVSDFAVDNTGALAYTTSLGGLNVINAAGATTAVPLAFSGMRLGNVAIAGGGRYLAYSGLANASNWLVLRDMQLGTNYTQRLMGPLAWQLPFRPMGSFSLSADGAGLLYEDAGQLRLINRANWTVDTLSALNAGGGIVGGNIVDASFTGLGSNLIAYSRLGQMQVFDRGLNAIDPLPTVNHLHDFGLFRTRFGSYFSRL